MCVKYSLACVSKWCTNLEDCLEVCLEEQNTKIYTRYTQQKFNKKSSKKSSNIFPKCTPDTHNKNCEKFCERICKNVLILSWEPVHKLEDSVNDDLFVIYTVLGGFLHLMVYIIDGYKL